MAHQTQQIIKTGLVAAAAAVVGQMSKEEQVRAAAKAATFNCRAIDIGQALVVVVPVG